MGIISQKLRASAKGEVCTFQIPNVCNGDPATTVLCHAPSEVKGMGSKGHDYHAAFGCYDCHTALDQHEIEDDQFYWLRGCQRTLSRWIEIGLVIIPVNLDVAKTRPKKKSNMSSRPIPKPAKSWPKRSFG